MKEALRQAEKAYQMEEVPIGAVIVKDGKIIARAYNKREEKMDATCHAEILAIKKACKKLNNWRLSDCSIYVTMEPCPMCAGAIVNSRISNLIFGARDEKSGAVVSNFKLLDETCLNHKTVYYSDVCADECSKIVKDFFKKRRNEKNKGTSI